MAALLKVELVTPARKLFAVDAEAVTFTGIGGEMGVLPGHIPVVTTLKPGRLSLKTPSGLDVYAVGGGVAQLEGDRVLILAESAEPAGEIDLDRAARAKEAAEKALREQSEFDATYAETRAALGRATARLEVVRKQ